MGASFSSQFWKSWIKPDSASLMKMLEVMCLGLIRIRPSLILESLTICWIFVVMLMKSILFSVRIWSSLVNIFMLFYDVKV